MGTGHIDPLAHSCADDNSSWILQRWVWRAPFVENPLWQSWHKKGAGLITSLGKGSSSLGIHLLKCPFTMAFQAKGCFRINLLQGSNSRSGSGRDWTFLQF